MWPRVDLSRARVVSTWGVEVGPAQIGELDVVEGVDADLVPLLVHPAHHVPVVLYLGSDEEKGGLHPALRETVQQAGGGGAGGGRRQR